MRLLLLFVGVLLGIGILYMQLQPMVADKTRAIRAQQDYQAYQLEQVK